MTKKMKNNCKWCGREFYTEHDWMAFCSSECKDLYYKEYKEQILRTCEICGGLFHPKYRNDRYCSLKCFNKGFQALKNNDEIITLTLTKDEIKQFSFIKDFWDLNNEITILLEDLDSDHAVNTVGNVIGYLIRLAEKIDEGDEC